MAYRDNLTASAAWLVDVQNADGGWGLTPKQASSMVNTAEALYVLAQSRKHNQSIERGLSFLRGTLFAHLSERGDRTRYVAFPLLAISECFPNWDCEFAKSLVEWLWSAHNGDGGWGTERAGSPSDLFSTFIATSALAASGVTPDKLTTAGQWVVSQGSDSGWSFEPDQTYSYAATSYALLALSHTELCQHHYTSIGKARLMQIEVWANEDQTVAGTLWRHCTYSLVLQALATVEDDLFCKPIAEGIRHANRLISKKGGWTEDVGSDSHTVRGQYWATSAFAELSDRLDPGKYIIRVEAERTQGVLKEPNFLPFAANTEWHSIVPARVYRATIWILFLIGIASAFGALSAIPRFDPEVLRAIGVIILPIAWYGVRIRRKQFPRLYKWGVYALLVLGLIGLLFGPSVWDIINHLIQWLGGLAD